jgi:hypothetical protein
VLAALPAVAVTRPTRGPRSPEGPAEGKHSHLSEWINGFCVKPQARAPELGPILRQNDSRFERLSLAGAHAGVCNTGFAYEAVTDASAQGRRRRSLAAAAIS